MLIGGGGDVQGSASPQKLSRIESQINPISQQASEPWEFLQNAFSGVLMRPIEANASDMPQGGRRSVESLRNEALDEIQKGTLRLRNLALARGMESGWNRAVSVPELGHVGTRAGLIAVTETGHAYEEGSRQAVERLQVRAPLTGYHCSNGPGSALGGSSAALRSSTSAARAVGENHRDHYRT